jgi:hypothetical protein
VLVAGIIDRIENRPYGTGRPPIPTIKVVETLRFFVREGVPWQELRATAERACGSTLRRRLDDWSATAVLRRAHVALVWMVRAGPEITWDVVVDSCSVRAKRGGELAGPNPTLQPGPRALAIGSLACGRGERAPPVRSRQISLRLLQADDGQPGIPNRQIGIAGRIFPAQEVEPVRRARLC